jgi:hypothetical protein
MFADFAPEVCISLIRFIFWNYSLNTIWFTFKLRRNCMLCTLYCHNCFWNEIHNVSNGKYAFRISEFTKNKCTCISEDHVILFVKWCFRHFYEKKSVKFVMFQSFFSSFICFACICRFIHVGLVLYDSCTFCAIMLELVEGHKSDRNLRIISHQHPNQSLLCTLDWLEKYGRDPDSFQHFFCGQIREFYWLIIELQTANSRCVTTPGVWCAKQAVLPPVLAKFARLWATLF